MVRKTRSAKGVEVNFDLMKIKEQIAAAPPSIDVRKRQDFIESRLRRRPKKKLPKIPTPESTKEVDVEPQLASVETEVAPMIEPPVVEEKKATVKKSTYKKKTSTQKARPAVKTEDDE